jgi:hypothetical protein
MDEGLNALWIKLFLFSKNELLAAAAWSQWIRPKSDFREIRGAKVHPAYHLGEICRRAPLSTFA